ncbi:hypothetical protein [Ruminococcus champanellensis]|uniref:hypothetical protein n=1 Tax=Ruminococcus champanellensis TaxID=1161942 RepID=UPI0026DC80E8|nr:hypothetical protein [Ruminococcus champanellensis]
MALPGRQDLRHGVGAYGIRRRAGQPAWYLSAPARGAGVHGSYAFFLWCTPPVGGMRLVPYERYEM